MKQKTKKVLGEISYWLEEFLYFLFHWDFWMGRRKVPKGIQTQVLSLGLYRRAEKDKKE